MEQERFWVGITGHRPNRIAPARLSQIQDELTMLLKRLITLIDGPVGLISCLAEGADRLAARSALDLGLPLSCPLPFTAAEYARDFAGEALVEFERLRAAAAQIVELPGSRADEPDAYELAGRYMLDRTDLLIAVWDGGPSAGRGGTRHMMDVALAIGVPVIWVHAIEDRAPELVRPAMPTKPHIQALIDGTRALDLMEQSGPGGA